MDSIREETVRSFNNYILERNHLGSSRLTLVQFNHEYHVVIQNKKIKNLPPLALSDYIPGGMTALYDAIGRTIHLTRERQESGNGKSQEIKTIIVIITDGYENASTRFTNPQVFRLIKKMEKKYGWEFVYLGANQDAIHEAARFGVMASRALTYCADSRGAKDAFESLGENLSCMLKEECGFEFNEEQRELQHRTPKGRGK